MLKSILTRDYSERIEPTGILKAVKDLGAFKAGTKGAETIPQFRQFGERIVEVPGKRGLNAFSNTDLDNVLKNSAITDVALAGVKASVCIDSTRRSAYERGYKVSVLSDCTSGTDAFEHKFYCEKIFPLYADVIDRERFLERLVRHDSLRQQWTPTADSQSTDRRTCRLRKALPQTGRASSRGDLRV